MSVMYIRPTGDVSTKWIPSSGSDNFAMVDEETSDGLTTYVAADIGAGYKDYYSHSDTFPYGATINSVTFELITWFLIAFSLSCNFFSNTSLSSYNRSTPLYINPLSCNRVSPHMILIVSVLLWKIIISPAV